MDPINLFVCFMPNINFRVDLEWVIAVKNLKIETIRWTNPDLRISYLI